MGSDCKKHILKSVRFHKITSFVSFVALQNQDISRRTHWPSIKESPWPAQAFGMCRWNLFPMCFLERCRWIRGTPDLADFPKG